MHDDNTTPAGAAPAQPGSPANGADPRPVDLKVKLGAQRLLITWSDGAESDLPFSLLRQQCPCAACRTERGRKDDRPLTVLQADPTSLRVTDARMVGAYAVQLIWSDGHNAGIFDFRALRALGTA